MQRWANVPVPGLGSREGDNLQEIKHYIHTHLQDNLTLGSLAARSGLSRFKLHRLFKASSGLTPARYVEQVRIYSAALALLINRHSILQVATAHGYHSHATFSRAFRRQLQCSPLAFRRDYSLAGHQPRHLRRMTPQKSSAPGYALSQTILLCGGTLKFAAIRHSGAYEAVPDRLWRQLAEQLRTRGLTGWGLLGVGYDNPAVTAADECRFDAGILVKQPFVDFADVRYREIPGAVWAATTYVGGYDSMSAAMPEIYQRSAVPGYEVAGLPLVELYQSGWVATDEFSHTRVLVPIRSVNRGKAN